jgi:DNA-binding response OmpR family regulator
MKKDSKASKKSVLFVTCEDTAPAIEIDVYEHLFKPPTKDINLFEESSYDGDNTQNLDLCLFSVACEMNVVGGEFGFRPRNEEDIGCKDYDKEIGKVTGSVFWFCIPCMECEESATVLSKKDKVDAKKPAITEGDSSKTDPPKSENANASDDSINKRKRRALIIEDSAIIRKMLNRIFTKLGFEVSEAENGMQGLEKLKSALYDITLVDFLMPIMDGLDCIQQYCDWERYHRPWMTQRIVGISAHASQEDVEKGLKIGMDDFRPKPISFKVLSDLIECDKQIDMSRRLDEIERREALSKNANNGDDDDAAINKPKKKHEIDGRACTLLMISPRSEKEHTKRMQQRIKSSGWQTTTASTEREGLVWLKMRNWDLVLVDKTLAPLIGEFRKWESKKRQNRQERVTLMAENVDESKGNDTEQIEGIDAMVRKPMGLNAVDKLLESTYLLLSKGTGK